MSTTNANLKSNWNDATVAGDFMFASMANCDHPTSMIFIFPCGCGDRSAIDLDCPEKQDAEQKWKWNGNREMPTLTPSLHKTSGCGWHGFLTDGVFRSC